MASSSENKCSSFSVPKPIFLNPSAKFKTSVELGPLGPTALEITSAISSTDSLPPTSQT